MCFVLPELHQLLPNRPGWVFKRFFVCHHSVPTNTSMSKMSCTSFWSRPRPTLTHSSWGFISAHVTLFWIARPTNMAPMYGSTIQSHNAICLRRPLYRLLLRGWVSKHAHTPAQTHTHTYTHTHALSLFLSMLILINMRFCSRIPHFGDVWHTQGEPSQSNTGFYFSPCSHLPQSGDRAAQESVMTAGGLRGD